MGFFDDVVNTVRDTVSTVSNTVNREVTNATDTVARGDISKGFAPLQSVNTAVQGGASDLVNGRSGQAGNRFVGAVTGNNLFIQSGEMSSSVRDFYDTQFARDVSRGYLPGVNRSIDATQNYIQGRPQDGDWRAIYNQNKTDAELVALAYGGSQAYDYAYNGGALNAYEYAAANPGSIALYGSIGASLSRGNFKDVANRLGAPDFVSEILPDGSSTEGARLPNTSDPYGGTQYRPKASSVSKLLFLAVVGALIYSKIKK